MAEYDYQNMDGDNVPQQSLEAGEFRVLSSMNSSEYEERRREDARQVAEDTQDMKEMMGDLGALIRDQGNALDTIEGQFQNSAHATLGAQNELIRAAERDAAARRRKFMCYTCLSIAAIIGIIYLYTHIFNK